MAEATLYRWRKQYGGMKASDVKRPKESALKNTRLKKVVADLTLNNALLRELAKGKW